MLLKEITKWNWKIWVNELRIWEWGWERFINEVEMIWRDKHEWRLILTEFTSFSRSTSWTVTWPLSHSINTCPSIEAQIITEAILDIWKKRIWFFLKLNLRNLRPTRYLTHLPALTIARNVVSRKCLLWWRHVYNNKSTHRIDNETMSECNLNFEMMFCLRS